MFDSNRVEGLLDDETRRVEEILAHRDNFR
jgi:hypothetical protein